MIKIGTAALKNAVAIAGNAVDRSATIPILGHLLCTLDADEQILRLTGTNMEQTVTATVPAQWDRGASNPPAWTLPHDKLRAILGATKSEQVRLNVSEKRASLHAGSARFQLAILPAADYPEPPEHQREAIKIPGATLRAALETTLTAAAIPGKEVRFYLCGIQIEGDGKTLTLVATDGHRMHVAAIPHASEAKPNSIIPRSTALTLARVIPDEDVTLHISETDLVADLGPVCLRTKLIGGKYPDWRRVVPKGERTRATCNALALHQAIGACSVLSNEDYRTIKFNLDPVDDDPGIHLSATNKEQEHSDDTVAASIAGEAMEAGYNAGYFTQALDAIPGSDVEINLTDGAAILRGGKGEGDADVYAVLMAVRL